MSRPLPGDYPPYFGKYIDRVEGDSPERVVAHYSQQLLTFYQQLPEELADHAYAPEKWTLKDVLQHVIDTERIMSYRLLRIARNDQTPLPGFEENDYALSAKASLRSFTSLKEELAAVRNSTDLLIQSLTPEQLVNRGNASGHPVTALALVYILYGHLIHHRLIIEERYL